MNLKVNFTVVIEKAFCYVVSNWNFDFSKTCDGARWCDELADVTMTAQLEISEKVAKVKMIIGKIFGMKHLMERLYRLLAWWFVAMRS